MVSASSSRPAARCGRPSTYVPTPSRRPRAPRPRHPGGSSPTSARVSTAPADRCRTSTCSASAAPRRPSPSSPPRAAVARTLDLGTGCGVQALHAAPAQRAGRGHRRLGRARCGSPGSRQHCPASTARPARTASLLEPVAGERFDLVVSNPPFVVVAPAAPRGTPTATPACRSTSVGARLAGAGAGSSRRAGRPRAMLANWVHARRRAVATSGSPAGCPPTASTPSWSSARCSIPPQYVATVAARRRRAGFVPLCRAVRRVAGRPGARAASRRSGSASSSPGAPTTYGGSRAARLAAPGRGSRWARTSPAGSTADAGWPRTQPTTALAAATVTLAADVVQEQVGPPGAADPEHLVLRQARRACAAPSRSDTATAALVGACDGTTSRRHTGGRRPPGARRDGRAVEERGPAQPGAAARSSRPADTDLVDSGPASLGAQPPLTR